MVWLSQTYFSLQHTAARIRLLVKKFMAKYSGIIPLQGTIGGISFYKSPYGYIARQKSSLNGERVKRDPEFARTRENYNEFSDAVATGYLLRKSVNFLLKDASDYNVTARMNGLMSRLKYLDILSARGMRRARYTFHLDTAQEMLKSFAFNQEAPLQKILRLPVLVNTAGDMEIKGLSGQHVVFVSGATHFTVRGCYVLIDFEAKTYQVSTTNVFTGTRDMVEADISFLPESALSGSGIGFSFLHVRFYQQLNGEMYALKNCRYNSLGIVGVHTP